MSCAPNHSRPLGGEDVFESRCDLWPLHPGHQKDLQQDPGVHRIECAGWDQSTSNQVDLAAGIAVRVPEGRAGERSR